MKKNRIAMGLAVATIALVSCKKENAESQTPETNSLKAVAAVLDTKAELAYRYDVLWQNADEIAVKDNAGANSIYELKAGAGTKEGTFSLKSGSAPQGAIKAFYPASVVDGANLVWPEIQKGGLSVPMYAEAEAATAETKLGFNSLGAIFRIFFSTSAEKIKLTSVTLRALGETPAALSGEFTVDAGKAVIVKGGKSSVTLQLAEGGVSVGSSPVPFDISIPAGTYADGFELVFETTGRTYCKMASEQSFTIAQNTVNTLILKGDNYRHILPEEALPGEFSVAAGKKVHFSRGNLTYDVEAKKWGFYANQYDCATAYSATLVSLFSWGYGEWSVNPAQKYATPDSFVDWGTAVDDFGTWRTPTKAEMNYLLNSRGNGMSKLGVSICGRTCLVLVPDGNTLEIADSYDATTWAAAEAAGFVCLPYVGYGNAGIPNGVNSSAYYWLNTNEGAPKNSFNIAIASDKMQISASGREWGYGVRLIVE